MPRRGRMLHVCCAALSIWLLATLSTYGQETITLSFNSLPSAQGWTFVSDGALETNVFALSNGVLTQNTLGGPYSLEYYRRFDVIHPLLPFAISVRGRVLAESGQPWHNSFGFAFSACTGTEAYGFGLGTHRIEDIMGSASTDIDNTIPHVYQLEVIPGIGYTLLVDGNVVTTGPPRPYTEQPNGLMIGDLTRGTGASAELTSYTFSQSPAISIDIKPGIFPNSVNPESKGIIPVAVLTTGTFDASTVNPLSVEFGPGKAKEVHGKGHLEDANSDGRKDMVLHFNIEEAGIQPGQTEASLIGRTISGQAIKAVDAIQTVEKALGKQLVGGEETPDHYALEPNYPNPFNPATTIRYSIPHRSHVTLTVFNTIGQLVATPVDGDVDAGYHDVQFNAGNLATGIYFYRLQAGSYTETRKFALMK